MTQAVHVKHARKDNKAAGIKKGDEYWFVSLRSGGRFIKRYFKSPPRRSQLTQSEYLAQAYDLEDNLNAQIADLESKLIADYDELAGQIEPLIEDLRTLANDQEDKLGNMPQSLQESDTGSLLQERADNCNNTADSLEDALQQIKELEEDPEHWHEDAASVLTSVSWEL